MCCFWQMGAVCWIIQEERPHRWSWFVACTLRSNSWRAAFNNPHEVHTSPPAVQHKACLPHLQEEQRRSSPAAITHFSTLTLDQSFSVIAEVKEGLTAALARNLGIKGEQASVCFPLTPQPIKAGCSQLENSQCHGRRLD